MNSCKELTNTVLASCSFELVNKMSAKVYSFTPLLPVEYMSCFCFSASAFFFLVLAQLFSFGKLPCPNSKQTGLEWSYGVDKDPGGSE